MERFTNKAVNQKFGALTLPLNADRKVAITAKPRRTNAALPKLHNLTFTFRLRKIVGGADSAPTRCFKAIHRRDGFPNFHVLQIAQEDIMDKVKRTHKAEANLYGAP